MRTTIVTGAASGIGRAAATALLADGHRVIGVDIAAPPADLDIDWVSADISTAGGVRQITTAIADDGLSDLVHCAAIGHFSSFKETPREDWERVLRVNLQGTIGLVQGLLPSIRRGGRIVLFSSGTVFRGPRNLFAYVASKAGVIGFARCLAEELGDDEITVNVVSPGFTVTPLIAKMAHTEQSFMANRALRRREYPQDLVGPVRFLLSDAAGFITGQTISVDGGSVKL